mmetsp:Transcript_120882/g.240819  ORF Transcript_120882/g.240819 Transcript_120882/m.240819 type:complete len:251 (+) Transcript_120882:367-1119(+)
MVRCLSGLEGGLVEGDPQTTRLDPRLLLALVVPMQDTFGEWHATAGGRSCCTRVEACHCDNTSPVSDTLALGVGCRETSRDLFSDPRSAFMVSMFAVSDCVHDHLVFSSRPCFVGVSCDKRRTSLCKSSNSGSHATRRDLDGLSLPKRTMSQSPFGSPHEGFSTGDLAEPPSFSGLHGSSFSMCRATTENKRFTSASSARRSCRSCLLAASLSSLGLEHPASVAATWARLRIISARCFNSAGDPRPTADP